MSSAIYVSLIASLNLFLNFVTQIAIASIYGATGELDAYIASSTIPLLLSTVFTGSLNFALTPQFVRSTSSSDENDQLRFLSALLLIVIVLFSIIAFLLVLFSNKIIALTNPGFDERSMNLASHLLRVQSIGLIFIAIASVLWAYHQARRRYLRIALGPLCIPFTLLLGTLILGKTLGSVALAYSAVLGAIMQFIILLPRKLPLAGIITELQRPFIRTSVRNLLPLLGGSIFSKTDYLVDRFFLSQLSPGSISHLWYSRKFIDASLLVSTSGISTTSFPKLSEHVVRHKTNAMVDELLVILNVLGFFLIPFTIFLCTFSNNLVQTLLERGLFRATDSAQVAFLIIGQAGVLLGGAFGIILANTFFALQDTRTPTIIGIVGYTIGIGLKIWLFTLWGVIGIAVATSVYTLLNCVAELAVLRSRILKGRLAQLGILYIKVTFFALLSAVSVQYITSNIIIGSSLLLLIDGVVFTLIFFGLTFLFKIDSLQYIYRVFRKRN